MQFFDCPSFYNEPDIFNSISSDDLQILHYDVVEKKIPFKPVTTDKHLPIRAAYIALNAYCGPDYPTAFQQPNFFVWAQDYKTIRGKLSKVMSRFQRGIPELSQTAFYYTNFVKVVLPNPPFQASAKVNTVLEKHHALRSFFRELLKAEIEGLIKSGCRIFICSGKSAEDQFKQTMQIVSGNSIDQYTLNGQKVFILSDLHFSRNTIASTELLIQKFNLLNK